MSLKRKSSSCVIVACAFFLALGGCAHYPANSPRTNAQTAPRYEFVREAIGLNTDSLFICLAFSGGGTRAAALSYGVLDKLRQTRITWKGIEKSLLNEVDCLSSISSGSFTAAYYGLVGDQIFQEFRPKVSRRQRPARAGAAAVQPNQLDAAGLALF